MFSLILKLCLSCFRKFACSVFLPVYKTSSNCGYAAFVFGLYNTSLHSNVVKLIALLVFSLDFKERASLFPIRLTRTSYFANRTPRSKTKRIVLEMCITTIFIRMSRDLLTRRKRSQNKRNYFLKTVSTRL